MAGMTLTEKLLAHPAGPPSFGLGGTASRTYTEKGAENFIAMVEVAEHYARANG